MSKFKFNNFFIYKQRYLIGYIAVAIALLSGLIFASLYLPGGLSNQEMQATVNSSQIDISRLEEINVINLPYYLLQKASLKIFGVSLFTIKLPSLILAIFSILGLFLLLKQWFRSRIAILTSLIAVVTSQFLFLAQNGTPEIMYLFWPVWLMYLSSLISSEEKRKNIHIIAFCLMAAFSLYTPLSLYVLLVFGISAIAHPHLRFYIFKKMPKRKLILGLIASVLLVSPLAFYILRDPSIALNLLGIPKGAPNLSANLSLLYEQFLSFSRPGGATMMTPFFELGSALIVIVGIYRLIITKSTAKSYTLMFWIAALIPLMIINPDLVNSSFLPLVILLASGLNWLLNRWYNLFPNNPYARIAGLVPVVILVSTLIIFGTNRYIFSYRYDPNIANSFSKDINLIPKDTKFIVASNGEIDFYNVMAKYNKDFEVGLKPKGDTFLATKKANTSFKGYQVTQIITTSFKDNSDRFYLYTKTAN